MDHKSNLHELNIGDIIAYNDEYCWDHNNVGRYSWQKGIVLFQLKDRKHCFKVRWLRDGDMTVEVSPLTLGNEFRVFSAPR